MNSEAKPYTCRQWLRQKYEEEEMALSQIARLCSTNKETIRYWMIKFGIPRRKKWSENDMEYTCRMPSYFVSALKNFSKQQGKYPNEILRMATVELMIKSGFNPFKDN